MQIVIEIPDDFYKKVQDDYKLENGDAVQIPIECIANGTPLPKGHWIEITQYSDAKHKIECSECGNHIIDRGHANSFNVKNKYKYCPNCGCRMESGDNDSDKSADTFEKLLDSGFYERFRKEVEDADSN